MSLLHDIVQDLGRMKSVEKKNMDFPLCWDAVERLDTSFKGM